MTESVWASQCKHALNAVTTSNKFVWAGFHFKRALGILAEPRFVLICWRAWDALSFSAIITSVFPIYPLQSDRMCLPHWQPQDEWCFFPSALYHLLCIQNTFCYPWLGECNWEAATMHLRLPIGESISLGLQFTALWEKEKTQKLGTRDSLTTAGSFSSLIQLLFFKELFSLPKWKFFHFTLYDFLSSVEHNRKNVIALFHAIAVNGWIKWYKNHRKHLKWA